MYVKMLALMPPGNNSHLFKTSAEPFEHSPHVSPLLHGYDPCVVLLIYPDQEVLLIIVPEKIMTIKLTSPKHQK